MYAYVSICVCVDGDTNTNMEDRSERAKAALRCAWTRGLWLVGAWVS